MKTSKIILILAVTGLASVLTISSFYFPSKPVPNNRKEIFFNKLRSDQDSNIYQAKFFPRGDSTPSGFQKIEGQDIGLSKGYKYGIRDYTDPFWFGRGTASGDYNKDGWPDIIFGSNTGFYLYKNLGGHFELQDIIPDSIKNFIVFGVSLVDMDNDGWLDIYFTTFNHGNYIILNRNGSFDTKQLIPVPNNNGVLTLSPGFSDLDKNGYLDIVNGNIALGVVTGFYIVDSRRQNSIVFNNKLTFKEAPIETDSGETMATLISDINNDGISDLYFGNDFMKGDKILIGTKSGFNQIKGNKFIPYTPFFSMGADTGDVNNDLKLDFLVTGTMYVAPDVGKSSIDGKSVEEYSEFKGTAKYCDNIKNTEFRKHCKMIRETNYIRGLDRTQIMTQKNKNEKPENCQNLNHLEKDICLTKRMWTLITTEENPKSCEKDYSEDKRLATICEILKIRKRKFERRDMYGSIPQDDRNMLYTFDSETKTLKSVDEFKHPGGWTWNSRIVDLDNDGWQDIVTSDGTIRSDDFGWNVLMKNIDGKRFVQRQFTEGLVSDFGLYSFVTVDMDNDGDLDLIGNSAEAPVQVYKNNSSGSNHSLMISLIDHRGNKFGIGAKIIVRSKDKNMAQIREIKASGGYMSFEPAIAHFGLGELAEIDSIEVQWSDNSKNVYPGPFEADHHYRIVRNKL